ncbi:MAG TPA: F0F1 ATP synthase subunit delta [Candidatus Paceibacterota bacterium]
MSNVDVYAEALWQTIKKGESPKKAALALKMTLERHGRSMLLSRIPRALARIAAREERRDGVVLSLAREKDAASAHKEIAETLLKMGAKKEDIKTVIDSDLIGGWRLEGRGELIDRSHKKQLLSIYENVIHS